MSATFYTTTPAVLKREFDVDRIVDQDGVELDDHQVVHVESLRLDRRRYGEHQLRAASTTRISSLDQPAEGQSAAVVLDVASDAPPVRAMLVAEDGDGQAR